MLRPSPWTTALVIGMPSTYMSVVKSWPPMTLPQRPIDCTPGIRNMNAVGSRGPPVFSTSGSAVYTSFRIVWPSLASAVASCGEVAVTSTSCVMGPTCSVTFNPITLRASTISPSRTNVWKPSSETVSRYSPGGSGVSAYTPALVVCLIVAIPVATFVAVTAGVSSGEPQPGRDRVIVGRPLRGVPSSAMKALVLVTLLAAGMVPQLQDPLPKDWIDRDTGHRVVRLTGDAGGSTLYFHDNAFSPQGDKVMVNTPDGIAIGDVAAIGTAGARLVTLAPRARGGYFARRTREVYYGGRGGPITAVNVDTGRAREVPEARWVRHTHAN